jgi:hypothetical protein
MFERCTLLVDWRRGRDFSTNLPVKLCAARTDIKQILLTESAIKAENSKT